MNPLITQYIWQISEAHLPELQFKIKNVGKAPQLSSLPRNFDARIKASGMAKAYNDYFTERYSTDKRVLVLPVHGEMSRESYWNYGNEFYMRQLNSALKDPDYIGAVLDIQSPGGTADSTSAFAQTVYNFNKVKPIVTSTAYCCSAALQVASQSSEIHIEDQASSMMGSIGTLLILENYIEYLKQQGVEVRIMRAKGSEDKALVNPYEQLPENAEAELQAMLDACQREFVGSVKRGRAGKITSSEVFTGKVYNATNSIRLGLADRKGDLYGAIKRVPELAA